MKRLTLVAATVLAALATHAYAAENEVATGTSDTNAVEVSQVPAAQPAAPMARNAASAGKTRAEVYDELVRAREDGSLARLNALFYSGG